MGGLEASELQVVVTGTGATRRWWLTEHSLAGLLARGPFPSARAALREAGHLDPCGYQARSSVSNGVAWQRAESVV